MKKLNLALFLSAILLTSGFAPSTKIIYDMPLVRQSTSYSCGAAALLSVLEYYGIDDYNESEVMHEVGTTPEKGTEIERMAAFAESRGLSTEVKSNVTLSALRRHVESGQGVIVDAQAWPDDGQPAKPYPETWSDGHYLVVIGVDDEKVYFMDPSLLGSRGFIPVKEFLDRWHEVSSKGEKLQHTALFFRGKPKPPGAWAQIP